MSRRTATLAAALAGALALGAGAAPASAAAATATARAEPEPFDVLVFSRTTGFRHASIPAAVAAIRELGAEHGFRVRATERPQVIAPRRLRRFAVVAFVNTTGDVLDARSRTALEAYVRGGGGFVGVHSAADTEDGSPFYGRLVGARFLAHPVVQRATLVNEAGDHPATAHLAGRFDVTDELYSFDRSPRRRARVLLSVDESTYEQDPNTTSAPGDGVPTTTGTMGDHPMAWCHDVGAGRAFYTALGHEPALYGQRWFRRHLLGGIRTAARAEKADCSR